MALQAARDIHGSEACFPVCGFVEWSPQGRFKEAKITDSVCAAKEGQLLGVDIENDGRVEPDRLAHFASAL